MALKMIVGLGNPGREYDQTRHNAGFMVVDALAERHARGVTPKAKFHAAVLEARLPGGPCLLVKPTTYMNRSGLTVGEATRFYKLDPARDLIVVTDDIALPVGTIRLRPSGGAGGHNGLRDIERMLGGQGYPRLRVGVGAPRSGAEQVGHVLGKFAPDERPLMDSAVVRSADAVEVFVAEGIDAAMNAFNTRGEDDGGGAFRRSPPPPTDPAGPLPEGLDPGWLGRN